MDPAHPAATRLALLVIEQEFGGVVHVRLFFGRESGRARRLAEWGGRYVAGARGPAGELRGTRPRLRMSRCIASQPL